MYNDSSNTARTIHLTFLVKHRPKPVKTSDVYLPTVVQREEAGAEFSVSVVMFYTRTLIHQSSGRRRPAKIGRDNSLSKRKKPENEGGETPSLKGSEPLSDPPKAREDIPSTVVEMETDVRVHLESSKIPRKCNTQSMKMQERKCWERSMLLLSFSR